MESSKKLIQLSPVDNVLVAISDIKAGEVFYVNTSKYRIREFVRLGHKVAAGDIKMGEKIIKFQVAIGSAIRNIKKGEHVHVHNMKSDFLPTYIIE